MENWSGTTAATEVGVGAALIVKAGSGVIGDVVVGDGEGQSSLGVTDLNPSAGVIGDCVVGDGQGGP